MLDNARQILAALCAGLSVAGQKFVWWGKRRGGKLGAVWLNKEHEVDDLLALTFWR
jgi:hypothetical protein